MKDYTLVLQNGTEVTLTENDMFIIHMHYERENLFDYLEENYDWDKKTLNKVTDEVLYLTKYKEYTEEDAIEICIKRFDLSTKEE